MQGDYNDQPAWALIAPSQKWHRLLPLHLTGPQVATSNIWGEAQPGTLLEEKRGLRESAPEEVRLGFFCPDLSFTDPYWVHHPSKAPVSLLTTALCQDSQMRLTLCFPEFPFHMGLVRLAHGTYIHINVEAKGSTTQPRRSTPITNTLNPIVRGPSSSSQIPSLSCSQAGPSAAMCQKVPASPPGRVHH